MRESVNCLRRFRVGSGARTKYWRRCGSRHVSRSMGTCAARRPSIPFPDRRLQRAFLRPSTGHAYFLTFWGPEKLPSPDDPEADPSEKHGSDAAHGHEPTPHVADHGQGHDSHDSPTSAMNLGPIMWLPLAVLAGGAVLVGLDVRPHALVRASPPEERSGISSTSEHLSTHGVVGCAMGFGLRGELTAASAAELRDVLRAESPIPGQVGEARWGRSTASRTASSGVDELYDAIIIAPTRAIAAVCKFVDVYFIDGLVRLVAWIPQLSWASRSAVIASERS